MEYSHVRFTLGDLACVAVADGSHAYPLENMFANVPLAEVEAALRARGDPVDFVTTPYTYLYVETEEARVLVDMGAGTLMATTGHLPDNLSRAGIDPGDIDAVFITHAHPDHIGGALDDAGHPYYANARFYIWADEWAFWSGEGAYSKLPARWIDLARGALEPVLDRLVLLDHEGEVMPGVEVQFSPGHTPGHMTVGFRSGEQRLFYTGDVVLHPLHLEHPDWLPVYDLIPEQADVSKQRTFDLAAREQILVLGQHFAPFPSVGRVTKLAKGWRWTPVDVG